MAFIRLEIAARIGLGKRGTHSRLARRLGISSQQLSHRLGGDYHLSIEEIGAIADFFEAPMAWPLYTWHTCEAAFGKGSHPTLK